MTISELTLFILSLLALICLSAFFSGAETALFSLSRARLLGYRQNFSAAGQAIVKLLDSYHLTLIVLIFGNMVVNVIISLISQNFVIGLHLNPLITSVLSVFFSVFILLIFGEVVPKSLALLYAEPISERIAMPLLFLCRLVNPLAVTADKTFSFILDMFGRKRPEPLNPEEYYSYLEMAVEKGAFTSEESELLNNAFQLKGKTVAEIMIARIDLVTVRKNTSEQELKTRIIENKKLFYPVIIRDIDDAESIVSAKDFFLLSPEQRPRWQHSKTLIPAIFIPENSSLMKAAVVMRKNRVPVALAVDEYGRTAGMIALEDIYNEIVGENDNEYEKPEFEIRRISADTWFIGGMIPLYALEEIAGIQFSEEIAANTLNGLFCEILGRLPSTGDKIEIAGLKIYAEKISRKRVVNAKVEKIIVQDAMENIET